MLTLLVSFGASKIRLNEQNRNFSIYFLHLEKFSLRNWWKKSSYRNLRKLKVKITKGWQQRLFSTVRLWWDQCSEKNLRPHHWTTFRELETAVIRTLIEENNLVVKYRIDFWTRKDSLVWEIVLQTWFLKIFPMEWPKHQNFDFSNNYPSK